MRALDWMIDGRDWPHREHSHFVNESGVRWHLQRMGAGPTILLLHGTGAATHSWRDLMPLLARSHAVLAMDLPAHGFTQGRPTRGLSLAGMSDAVDRLLKQLGATPALVVGHSAGAAIAARMVLDGRLAPKALVSLNGALATPPGFPTAVFSPVARLLASTSWAPKIFAWSATDRSAVERLVERTGSKLDAVGLELYGRLIRNAAHVSGVLEMMAAWDLPSLERELHRLDVPVCLVAGSNDRAVPPDEAHRLERWLPQAEVERLPGLGHLAHEEAPAKVAEIILRVASRYPGAVAHSLTSA